MNPDHGKVASWDPLLSINRPSVCLNVQTGAFIVVYEKVIFSVYVDDTLLYSPTQTEIDKTLNALRGIEKRM